MIIDVNSIDGLSQPFPFRGEVCMFVFIPKKLEVEGEIKLRIKERKESKENKKNEENKMNRNN